MGDTSGSNDEPLEALFHEDYKPIDLSEVVQYERYQQVFHLMIYCKHEKRCALSTGIRANVLMLVRDTGNWEFPGGSIDCLGTHKVKMPFLIKIVQELVEQDTSFDINQNVNLTNRHLKLSKVSYLQSWFNFSRGEVVHFFTKQVQEADLSQIELYLTCSQRWGHQIIGVARTPIVIERNSFLTSSLLSCSIDNSFAVFLGHCFGYRGLARVELLEGLYRKSILTGQEIEQLLKSAEASRKDRPALYHRPPLKKLSSVLPSQGSNSKANVPQALLPRHSVNPGSNETNPRRPRRQSRFSELPKRNQRNRVSGPRTKRKRK